MCDEKDKDQQNDDSSDDKLNEQLDSQWDEEIEDSSIIFRKITPGDFDND